MACAITPQWDIESKQPAEYYNDGSVGVTRQYCGALGKVGNCQFGGFLAYVSERGHALIDTRLLLPREGTNDPTRCRAAGVPDEVGYQTTGTS